LPHGAPVGRLVGANLHETEDTPNRRGPVESTELFRIIKKCPRRLKLS
jgi:hypothetical protein